MKHLKLKCGFEVDIDETIFEDMELFEAIAAMQKGQPLALTEVITKVLGDQKAALYDHLRDEKGRVPIKDVSDAVIELFQGSAGKNS